MGGRAFGTRSEAAPAGALPHYHRPHSHEVHRSPVAFNIQEISDVLGLKFPPDNGEDTRPAVDRPRTLGEIKNAVEFLVRMDELVWRRSEYGANQGVLEPENLLAVEDRIRLWERIARGHCPK